MLQRQEARMVLGKGRKKLAVPGADEWGAAEKRWSGVGKARMVSRRRGRLWTSQVQKAGCCWKGAGVIWGGWEKAEMLPGKEQGCSRGRRPGWSQEREGR